MQARTWVRWLLVIGLFWAATAVEAGEPIRIGAILSVTGPAAFLGAPEARTLEMLVEAQNKHGGIAGRQIQ